MGEGASVVLSGGDLGLGHDDFPASVRLLVFPLTYPPEVMVYGVFVLLVELLEAHFTSELALPPMQRLLVWQSKAFEEQPKLQPTRMLDMALLLNFSVQPFHAWREAGLRVLVQILKVDLV